MRAPSVSPLLAALMLALGIAVLLVPRAMRESRQVMRQEKPDPLTLQAQAIAQSYRTFGATKIDRAKIRDVGLSVAPCAPPELPPPADKTTAPPAPKKSDPTTGIFTNGSLHLHDRSDPVHGRKVYALFAKDESAFRLAPTHEQPVGQAVVKEAWAPEEITGKVSNDLTQVVQFQGRTYRAGEARGLFLIFKVDPATPGTDNGWVYATVAADRTTVTACGVLPLCADCHNRGGKDRLFGPIRH